MPSKVNQSAEQVADVDPLVIYFTFSRIRPRFSCGRTIESTLQQFRDGALQPRDLPLLSVLTDGTHYFSQNNRRLYTYKQLKREGLLDTVPVRLRPFPQTKRMQSKYTPETCALTATLMRDVERSEASPPTSAAAKETKSSDEESGAEEEPHTDSNSSVPSFGRNTQQEPRNPGQHSSPREETMPSGSHGECAKEDLADEPAEAVGGELSRKQKKNQRISKKASAPQQPPQQQPQASRKNAKKGRRGGGYNDSDADAEEDGGVSSLEAELRKLGLQ